jgi:hypothetical protein
MGGVAPLAVSALDHQHVRMSLFASSSSSDSDCRASQDWTQVVESAPSPWMGLAGDAHSRCLSQAEQGLLIIGVLWAVVDDPFGKQFKDHNVFVAHPPIM